MALGAVNIAIGATTTDFQKALNAASQTVGRFRDNYKTAFEGLSTSSDKPRLMVMAVNRELSKTSTEIKGLILTGKQIPPELATKFYALKSSVDAVNGSIRVNNASVNGGSSSLMGYAAGWFSITAAIGGVRQALSITSDINRVNVALKASSKSAEDYAHTQEFIEVTADQLGLSFQALGESYKGIKKATENTALEGAETERIFKAVVRASAAMQLSSDDTKGSLLALQQMISKGNVSAEELRGQLGERLPGAFRLFAESMGVSEGKLNDMLKNGEVMAVDVLPKFAQKLEESFGASAQANVNEMTGGFQRLTDQGKLFVAEFTNTSGLSGFATEVSNSIADMLAAMRKAMRSSDWLAFFGALDPMDSFRVRAKSRATDKNRATVSDYRLMSPQMRQARMQVTADEFTRIDKELKASQGSTVIDSNKRIQLKERRQQLIELYQELVKVNFELQKTENGGKAGTAKDRLKELKSQIENFKFKGLEIPDSVQSEYDSLKGKIDAIGGSFKKAKADKVQLLDISDAAVYERQIERIQKGLLNFSGTDSQGKTYNRNEEVIANLRQLIKEAKALESGKRMLFELPKRTDKNGNLTDELKPKTVAALPREAEMVGNARAGILANGFDPVAQAQRYKVAVAEIEGAFNSSGIESAMARFSTLIADGMNIEDAKNKVLGSLHDLNDGVREILKAGAVDILAGTGEWIGAMASGMAQANDLPKMLLGTLGGVAQQLGRLAIGIGVGMESIKETFRNLTGIGAIAAGVGLIALGALFKAGASRIGGQLGGGGGAVPFADGGLVFGPTLGLIGEGVGTTKRNPEVVAPLDRLQSMIGGGRVRVYGDFRLRGSDLVVAFDRANQAGLD